MATMNSAGFPKTTANGQLIIGSTAGAPLGATLTASTNITITEGAGTVTVALTNPPGLHHLSTQTASGSATLDFDNLLDSTYEMYLMILHELTPADDDVGLSFRVGTGATPTYVAGTSYDWKGYTRASATLDSDTATSEISLLGESGTTDNLGNAAGESLYSGLVLINNSQDSAAHTQIRYKGMYFNKAGSDRYPRGGGAYVADTVVTSIRLLVSSGNIASGTATLYGVAQA